VTVTQPTFTELKITYHTYQPFINNYNKVGGNLTNCWYKITDRWIHGHGLKQSISFTSSNAQDFKRNGLSLQQGSASMLWHINLLFLTESKLKQTQIIYFHRILYPLTEEEYLHLFKRNTTQCICWGVGLPGKMT